MSSHEVTEDAESTCRSCGDVPDERSACFACGACFECRSDDCEICCDRIEYMKAEQAKYKELQENDAGSNKLPCSLLGPGLD